MFTFELYGAEKNANGDIAIVNDALMEVTNVGKNFAFADSEHLTYSEAGTYYYVVKEKLPEGVDANGKLDGITYDTKSHVVTVEVTKSVDATGRSVLTATVTPADTNGVVIINSYTTDETSFVISGTKQLHGRTLANEEFTFVLYDDKGGKLDEAKNDENGGFSFKEISIKEAGTYTYTVKEDTSKNEEGMAYDENVYTVVLTVRDNGKGKLTIEDRYYIDTAEKDEVLFVNEYSEPPVAPPHRRWQSYCYLVCSCRRSASRHYRAPYSGP